MGEALAKAKRLLITLRLLCLRGRIEVHAVFFD